MESDAATIPASTSPRLNTTTNAAKTSPTEQNTATVPIKVPTDTRMPKADVSYCILKISAARSNVTSAVTLA